MAGQEKVGGAVGQWRLKRNTGMKLRAGLLFGFHPLCGFFEGFVLAAVAVGFGFWEAFPLTRSKWQ